MPPIPGQGTRVAQVYVDVDGRDKKVLDALERIARAQEQLADKAERANKRIAVSTRAPRDAVRDFEDAIQQTQRTIDRLNAKGIDPRVTRDAKRDLDTLIAKSKYLSENDIRIAASVIGNADEKLRRLEIQADRLDGDKIELKVDADTMAATAKLAAIAAEVHNLQGRVITQPAQRSIRSLIQDFNEADRTGRKLALGLAIIGTAGSRLGTALTPLGALIGPAGLAGLIGAAVSAVTYLIGGATAAVAPLGDLAGGLINVGEAAGRTAPILLSVYTGLASVYANLMPLIQATTLSVTKLQTAAQAVVAAQDPRLTRQERTAAIQAANTAMDQLTGTERKYLAIQVEANKVIKDFQQALARPGLHIYANALAVILGTARNVFPIIRDTANFLAKFSDEAAKLGRETRFQFFIMSIAQLGQDLIKMFSGPLLHAADALRAVVQASIPDAERLGGVIAAIIDDLARMVLQAEKSGELRLVFEEAWRLALALITVVKNLADAFWTLFRSGDGAVGGLALAIVKLSKRFDDFAHRITSDGSFQKWLLEAEHTTEEIAKIFWQLGRILIGVFSAARQPGLDLYQDLLNYLTRIANYVNTPQAQAALRKFFQDSIPVVERLGGVILDLGKAFVQIGILAKPTLDILLTGLETFDRLPLAVRGTVAAMAALAAVMAVTQGTMNGVFRIMRLFLTPLKQIAEWTGVWEKKEVGKTAAVGAEADVLAEDVLATEADTAAKVENAAATDALAASNTKAAEAGAAGAGEGLIGRLKGAFKRKAPGVGAAATVGEDASAIEGVGEAATKAEGPIARLLSLLRPLEAIFGEIPVAGWVVVAVITAIIGVIDAFRSNFLGARDRIVSAWNNLKGAFSGLGDSFRNLKRASDQSGLSANLESLWNALKTVGHYAGLALEVFGKFIGFLVLAGVAAAINRIADFVKVIGLFIDALAWLIRHHSSYDGVIAGFIESIPGMGPLIALIENLGKLKSLLEWLSQHKPDLSLGGGGGGGSTGSGILRNVLQAFNPGLAAVAGQASGGYIPGTGRGDKVPARLEPGEYVIRRDVVKAVGREFFDRLNAGTGLSRVSIAGMRQSGGLTLPGAGDAAGVSRGINALTSRTGTFGTDIHDSLRSIRDDVKATFQVFYDTVREQTAKAKDKVRQHMAQIQQNIANSLGGANADTATQLGKLNDNFSTHFDKLSNSMKVSTKQFKKMWDDFLFDRNASQSDKNAKALKDFGMTGDELQSMWKGVMAGTTGTHYQGVSYMQKTVQQFMEFLNLTVPGFHIDHPPRFVQSQVNRAAAAAFHLGEGRGRATGGRIEGAGVHDTVPAMLAPGEAVLNRHQEAYLEGITGMPGILDHVMNTVRTPHFMAAGGRVEDLTQNVRGLPARLLRLLRDEDILPDKGVERFAQGGRALVSKIVQEANRINNLKLRYVYGGGHVTPAPANGPFDCSSAVSRVLQASGVKVPTMVSGDYMRWGRPGRGAVSILANPGHMYMVIGNRGWGTSTSNPGGGPGWLPYNFRRGFAVRHVPGITDSALDSSMANIGGGLTQQVLPPRVRGGGTLGRILNAEFRFLANRSNTALTRAQSTDLNVPPGQPGTRTQLMGWLTAALRATGHYSVGNLNALYGRAMQESGGNPRAINRWDINAQRGDPSRGLLQTIGSTFNHYKMRGHGNIWNPVDNAIAAIRYMYSRYGHIVGPGPGGYARGGRVGFQTGGRLNRFVPRIDVGARGSATDNQVRAALNDLKDALKKASIEQIKAFEGVLRDRIKQLRRGGVTPEESREIDRLSRALRESTTKEAQDELKGLTESMRRIINTAKKNFADIFHGYERRFFRGLRNLVGDEPDFTTRNIRNIAKVLAEEHTLRRIANQRLAKDNEDTKQNERAASRRLRESARQALRNVTDAVKSLVENIANNATAVFDRFQQYLQTGTNLVQSRLSAVTTASDQFAQLNLLTPQEIEFYRQQIQKTRRELTAFTLTQRFEAQAIRVSRREISSLADRMNLLRQVAARTGANVKNAMETVRESILGATQAAIDNVNQFFATAKAKLDQDLSDEITRDEQARNDAINNLQKQYDAQVKAFDTAQTAITAIQEREQRRRDRLATQRSLGQALDKEFFTQDDLDRITQLQQQLADQLQQDSEANRQQIVSDARARLDTNLQTDLDTINKRYDDLEKAAQTRYAQALVTLTNQTQATISHIVDQSARALGVSPGKIWDWILGAGTLPTKKADDATKKVVQAVLGKQDDMRAAGEALMKQLAKGIENGSDQTIAAIVAALRKIRDHLPSSDAKVGPFSDISASGRAFWTAFQSGLEQGAKDLEFPIPQAPGLHNILNPNLTAVTRATSQQILKIQHEHLVKIDARGLTDAEKAALKQELSRDFARQAQLDSISAISRPFRLGAA